MKHVIQTFKTAKNKLNKLLIKKFIRTKIAFREHTKKLLNQSGQGTTEYAILVGVLVVIAILAIMIFKPKLEELWNAIADGISGL